MSACVCVVFIRILDVLNITNVTSNFTPPCPGSHQLGNMISHKVDLSMIGTCVCVCVLYIFPLLILFICYTVYNIRLCNSKLICYSLLMSIHFIFFYFCKF